MDDDVIITETENEDGTKSYEIVQNSAVTTEVATPNADPDTPDPATPPKILPNTTGNQLFVSSEEDLKNFSEGSSVFLDLDGEGFKEYTIMSYFAGQSVYVSGNGLEFEDVSDIFLRENKEFAQDESLSDILVVADRTNKKREVPMFDAPISLASVSKIEPIKLDPIEQPADPQAREAKSYREFRDAIGDFSTISEIESEE